MSSLEINSVLAQIRALSTQAQSPAAGPAAGIAGPALGPLTPGGPTAPASEPQSAFASMLREGIDSVASRQKAAGDLQQRFEMGDPSVDLAQVMLASNKSSVAFRGMVEVRNRLVSAYQDVMNMPI